MKNSVNHVVLPPLYTGLNLMGLIHGCAQDVAQLPDEGVGAFFFEAYAVALAKIFDLDDGGAHLERKAFYFLKHIET